MTAISLFRKRATMSSSNTICGRAISPSKLTRAVKCDTPAIHERLHTCVKRPRDREVKGDGDGGGVCISVIESALCRCALRLGRRVTAE